MSSVETTELKLKTTPTGGLEAHTSPYYRRLMSAGYKGFLQGSIGGAGLYGSLGLVVGTLIAVPTLMLNPAIGFGILALIPTAGALGLVKGAATFGNIGSIAAINAESAELSEQRRYLLDRYYDLPDGPAGEREAEAIKQELYKRQTDSQKPPHFFHWKTVIIGAVLGGLLATGFMLFAAPSATLPLVLAIEKISTTLAATFGIAIPELAIGSLAKIGATTTLGIMGAAAGALTGATIGIDRYYIRKWFDHTQDVVHSSSHTEGAIMERTKQVERLKEANREDQKTQLQMDQSQASALADAAIAKASQSSAATVAQAKSEPQAQQVTTPAPKPKTEVTQATLERRVADLDKAGIALEV